MDINEITGIEEETEGWTYEAEVSALINARYTIDDQIALLRQKDIKPDEYNAFYSFCEEIKASVKEHRGITPEA